MANIEEPIRVGNTLTNLLDSRLGTPISFDVVTNWYDGTPMTDQKCDGYIYRKAGTEYFLKNLGEYTQVLQKNTLEEVRNLTDTDILLLEIGYYKYVQLNGYYVEGDAPTINYFWNKTSTKEDNSGNIIKVNSKVTGRLINTVNVINLKNFGVFPDGVTNYDAHVNKAVQSIEGALYIEFTEGITPVISIKTRSFLEFYSLNEKTCIVSRHISFSPDNYSIPTRDLGIFEANKPDDSDGFFQSISIRNLTIDGNVKNLTITDSAKVAAIKTHNINFKLVDGVYITNVTCINAIQSGIGTNGCNNVELDTCKFNYNGIDTFNSTSMSRNGISLNGKWYNETTAKLIDYMSYNWKVKFCEINYNTQEGIMYAFVKNFDILNNTISYNLDRAIEGDNSFHGGDDYNTLIQGNFMEANRLGCVSFSNFPENQRVIIKTNFFKDCPFYAVRANATDTVTTKFDLIIEGNIFDNMGANAASTDALIYAKCNNLSLKGNIGTNLYLRPLTVQQLVNGKITGNSFEAAAERTISAMSFNIFQNNVPIDSLVLENNNFYNYTGTIYAFAGSSVYSSVTVKGSDIINATFMATISAAITNLTFENNISEDKKTTPSISNMITFNAGGSVTNLLFKGNSDNGTAALVSSSANITNFSMSDNRDGFFRDKGLNSDTPPSVTTRPVGTKIWINAPNPNGFIGYVYLGSGTGLGWKGFGVIADNLPIKITKLTSSSSSTDRTLTDASFSYKREAFIEVDCTGGATQIFLPISTNSGTISHEGKRITVMKTDNLNSLTIGVRPSTTETINGSNTSIVIPAASQFSSYTFISDGADWKIVGKNL